GIARARPNHRRYRLKKLFAHANPRPTAPPKMPSSHVRLRTKKQPRAFPEDRAAVIPDGHRDSKMEKQPDLVLLDKDTFCFGLNTAHENRRAQSRQIVF